MITWKPISEMPEELKDGRKVELKTCWSNRAFRATYKNGLWRDVACDACWYEIELSHFRPINPPEDAKGVNHEKP